MQTELLLFTLLFAIINFVNVNGQSSTNAAQLCRNKQAGLYPHEEYCDYYYECDSSGEAFLQACPNGLAFAGNKRGIVGNCDYPHRVGCPDGTRIIGQKPITAENCSWLYGVFPHATSCTRYWQCWNGTATIQQCPFSLLYNDALHACDWPDNVPDCQKHPICKDTPNGQVSIEKSCVRYWLCVGGYPRLQRCPAGLAFNPTDHRCELASSVPGCEPPPVPSTSAPDEDEEERPANKPQSAPQSNSRAQGGSLPQQFRPTQPGVRHVAG